MMRRGALLVAAALVVAGCGAQPRQDEDEPEGEFPVTVTQVSFPENQSLAKDSSLVVEVLNPGDQTIPNINVTVAGFDRTLRDPSNPAEIDPGVADPERPVFVVDKSPVDFQRDRSDDASLVDREVNPPAGQERRGSAYVNTYSLGQLGPDDTARFRWDVSAVEDGPFALRYEVNAGLHGNALAVRQGGQPLIGTFEGVIDATPPPARVAADGETIVNEPARPSGRGGRGVIE